MDQVKRKDSEETALVNRNLLIVDDEQSVINSLRRELGGEGYEIFSVNSSKDGLGLIKKVDMGVVLSDQVMPGMDGITFLELLKQHNPDTVRILLTGYGSLDSAMAAINNSRVYSYLTKPWASEDLKRTVAVAFEHYNLIMENKRLQKLIQKQNEDLKCFNADLEHLVHQRTKQLKEALREGIVMLSLAAEAKDGDTGGHVHRIRELTNQICTGLGISPEKSDEISFFSMMHDIGKIHTPDHILKKKGPLSPEEWQIMQTHCIAGEKILGNKQFYRTARQIARNHHERWDGNGYPDRLMGEAIPLAARIVTIADVFDALTHDRPYKKAWPVGEATEEMKTLSGKAFDPEILAVFFKIQNENAF